MRGNVNIFLFGSRNWPKKARPKLVMLLLAEKCTFSPILTKLVAYKVGRNEALAIFFQESPRHTKPKKGQFMNFTRGHSGTKVRCESCLFSQGKTPEFTKMGEIHELFALLDVGQEEEGAMQGVCVELLVAPPCAPSLLSALT